MDANLTKTKISRRQMFQAALATLNLQRCLVSALLFAIITPFILIIFSSVQKEATQPYLLQGVFFAISSGAFAYLINHVLSIKAKFYYNIITYSYLIYLTLYLCVFGGIEQRLGQEPLFYYAAVLIGAYLPFLSMLHYAALCGVELLGLLLFVLLSGNGVAQLPIDRLAVLAAVHIFAFLLSRENYGIRIKIVLAEQKLKKESKEAERDPMTGLINRRGLDRVLQPVWEECVRSQELVATMIIDIDHFKAYNDKYGHVQGDTCIRRVAQSLASSVEGVATVARIGGEEFLIFVHGLEGEDILALAETVRSNVEKMQIPQAEGRGSRVTISVGVDMEYACEDISFTGLYGRADKQLYKAKQTGRNRVISNALKVGRRHRIS